MAQATILLVDDEIPFVETLTKRLSKRGIDILSAFSGQDALLLLAAGNDVDIVILDVKMPGMGGLETLAEIKRQYPAIEVILLTGHSTVDTAVKGMRLGAFDYLTKPCELEALMEKIEDAAKVGSQRR
ncbi:MAG: response regulator [Deltaproteobacteria bacterium]|nr:response regulator [Deltaproteobacteria bacterium]MBW1816566.1 response regulator [Deltaproteobacteria bacterium]MBW2283968.1 response regulator [Deltaproteobacteria bacterium]